MLYQMVKNAYEIEHLWILGLPKAATRPIQVPSQQRPRSQKNMALALDCQMAFITHVLKGDKDLSAEQALKTAKHLNFKASEIEYFVDLVAYNRAGTKDLREFFLKRIQGKKEQFASLQNRFEETAGLSPSDQARYYSHWLYAAIHMAATIPRLQSVEGLAEYFHISRDEVTAIVEFLSNKGLVRLEMGRIQSGLSNVYVGADSPFVQHHNMIWRSMVMQSSRPVAPEDLQYSLCFTASEKDWPFIRETLVRAVEECLAVIRPSEPEKLGTICIDLRPI
jgi:uncharacterized protein (TIGR02147 family)